MSDTALTAMPSTGAVIGSYLGNDAVKESITKVLPEKVAEMFFPAIISAVQATPALKECTCSSIVSGGVMGAALQLPPSPQLGYFHLVPYKTKKNIGGRWVELKEAQFILGYKGYIQLAIRSGQYKNIVCSEVKEGEIDYNPITEEIDLHPIKDPAKREKARTIGYYAAFELLSGFKKQTFMSVEAMHAHAKKYSSAYRYDLTSGKKSSPWTSDFDSMARKTMIRMLLSKWGIMSVEMQQAYMNDMAVIDEDGSARYVDNQTSSIEVQVQEEIAENANSVDFEEEVMEEPLPINEPTEEAIKAAEEMPDTPKRGRKKTVQTEVKEEPKEEPIEVAPDWA